MATPKVLHGARAQVYVNGKLVGLLHNISYNVVYDTQDAYVLGRLSAAEIGYTAQEPVTGTLSGWRVVGNGPHIVGLPALQDLLTADYTTLVVIDRLNPTKRVGSITGVRLTGHSGGQAARQFSETVIPYKGLLMGDESVVNVEPAGSSDLP
jgi:hypothetical protein